MILSYCYDSYFGIIITSNPSPASTAAVQHPGPSLHSCSYCMLEKYVGRSCGPGGIQFVWGEGPRDCVSYQTFFPEEGDMFIFPAWLKHHVQAKANSLGFIVLKGGFLFILPYFKF